MVLPNFLIIGAAKAGTTSLHHYLGQHPDIYMSPLKETNFFAYDPSGDIYSREIAFRITSLACYENLFAGVSSEQAIGEVSPLYLENAASAVCIYQLIPNVRLVAVLREPIDRALSAYAMRLRKGWERVPVSDAISPSSHYVQNGLYYARLQPYFKLFPRKRIKLLLFEELKQDGVGTLQSIFRFLEVDDSFSPNTSVHHNAGGLPRFRLLNDLLYNCHLRTWLRPIIPKPLRTLIRAIWKRNLEKLPADLENQVSATVKRMFYQDVVALQEMTGLDLSAWLPRYELAK